MKTDTKTKNELITELDSVHRKVKKLETLLKKRKPIEKDITERKKRDEELAEAQRLYRELFENVSVGILRSTPGPEGTFVDMNPAMVRMFEADSREQLMALHPSEIYWDASQRKIISDSIVAKGFAREELVYKTLKGKPLWCHINAVRKIDANGQVYLDATIEDITERKLAEQASRRAEEALRASEERHRTTLYSIGDAVITTDTESRVQQMNPVAARLTGWSEAEAVGKPLLQVFHIVNEETRSEVENPVARVLREGTVVGLANHSALIAKDGTEDPIADSGAPIRNENGEITGVVLVFRDQTEERAAQRSVRESEERFRIIFEQSTVGKSLTLPGGKLLKINKAFAEMLGRTIDEMQHLNFAAITHRDDVAESSECIRSLLANERSTYRMEKRYQHKNGAFVWTDVSTTLLRDKGGIPLYFITSIADISERKRATEALREANENLEKRVLERTRELASSNRLLDETGRLARVGGWEIDLKKNELSWSEVVKQIHEVQPEFQPTVETGINFYAPEAIPIISEAVRRAIEEGHSFDVELQLITAKQNRIWVRAIGQAYREDGEIVRVGGVFQDINDRKLAEIELKRYRDHLEELIKERTAELVRSRELLVEAQTMAHLGSWQWDAVKDDITGSEEFCRLFGVSQEQIAHFAQFLSLLHADDRERVQQDVADSMEQRKLYDTDYRVVLPDGKARHINARGQVFVDDSGKPLRMVGTCMDITERKLAEQELREREARYKTLVENIPQKILMKDRNCRWVSINENLARDFGFRPEEVVGKTDTDLFTPELAAKYHSDDVRIMETGKTEELEEKYMVGGKETWVNTIKTPVRDASGEIVGVLGVFWDITERKLAESQIRKLNRMYLVLSEVNQAIVRIHDPKEMFEKVCRIAVEQGGFAMTWIGLSMNRLRRFK